MQTLRRKKKGTNLSKFCRSDYVKVSRCPLQNKIPYTASHKVNIMSYTLQKTRQNFIKTSMRQSWIKFEVLLEKQPSTFYLKAIKHFSRGFCNHRSAYSKVFWIQLFPLTIPSFDTIPFICQINQNKRKYKKRNSSENNSTKRLNYQNDFTKNSSNSSRTN